MNSLSFALWIEDAEFDVIAIVDIVYFARFPLYGGLSLRLLFPPAFPFRPTLLAKLFRTFYFRP